MGNLRPRKRRRLVVTNGEVTEPQYFRLLEFTVQQFQDARRTCKDSVIELVISNPCFEAWPLDHLARCPDSHSETKDVERKAADLRIVGGSRDKHINYDKIEGARDSARKSTSGHNTEERGRRRAQLNSLDFGSWTDMAAMVTKWRMMRASRKRHLGHQCTSMTQPSN